MTAREKEKTKHKLSEWISTLTNVINRKKGIENDQEYIRYSLK